MIDKTDNIWSFVFDTCLSKNKKGIFITATNTDMGKTYISALLVKKLRQMGINAGYYKPALSGAVPKGQRLVPGDAAYVCAAANLDHEPEALVSYIFEKAVSPHLAAQSEGVSIDCDTILRDFSIIKDKFEFVVVEGCGGISCPLYISPSGSTPPLLLSDIIRLLSLDTVIVADSAVGTINSTVLTAEYAANHGIHVSGIILNHYDHENFVHRDNKKQIEYLTGIPVAGCVPSAFSQNHK